MFYEGWHDVILLRELSSSSVKYVEINLKREEEKKDEEEGASQWANPWADS